MSPRCSLRPRRMAASALLLLAVVVVMPALNPASAQTADPTGATPLPNTVVPVPTASPVPTAAASRVSGLTAYEERTLAQQDRIWWVTIAALVTTAAVTVAGWIVTYQQQARLSYRQELASAQLQEKIVRVQEQLERERALSTTKLERLKALADYLEFPNQMAGKRNPDELQQLYCDQWEVFYGFYFQLAIRFDSETGELPRLMRQMDEHIDRWARSIADGTEVAAAARVDLIPAMKFSRSALDRLDAIESRLVMGKLEIGAGDSA